jgi:hypothetical protein
MSPTYIIETREGAAGIVVRDGRGFRFFAATRKLSGLDGRLFATPRAAEAAAFDHLYGLNARGRAAPGGKTRPLRLQAADASEELRGFSPYRSTTVPALDQARDGWSGQSRGLANSLSGTGCRIDVTPRPDNGSVAGRDRRRA